MSERKEYNLNTSNRITYEDLEDAKSSVFEEVYREADETLYKIVQQAETYVGKDGKDDFGLNVLSFLGERGRGKTSVMLSFLSGLKKLRKECRWSKFYDPDEKREEVHFITLPYIDAAMLAENEYVFDVILAQMWDEFEYRVESEIRSRADEEDSAYLEQKIKKAFIEVRKAYLVLKEREKEPVGARNGEMPTPGALHELAVSLNLRTEMRKLVDCYLQIFGYAGRQAKEKTFLVITIDDIDMSGNKAQLILEQIRQFLRIPRVIVMLSADIDRLQLACESRYINIYPKERDRRRFINEYLEKVLPYNMRMYMPEVGEHYDEIWINKNSSLIGGLELNSENEKDMILEFIARECKIYFDGNKKKRHFLQNQSMRSMVNCFEQMARVKGIEKACTAWLKVDLKERLIERIQDTEQREFVSSLLLMDYEDINLIVLDYIDWMLEDEELVFLDGSLGQVLYECGLMEKKQDTEFVNCILVLYSVIMKQVDSNLKQKILGNSALGAWEYMAMQSNPYMSDLCPGFRERARLEIDVSDFKINSGNVIGHLNRLIQGDMLEDIEAWAYSLVFFTVIPLTGGNVAFQYSEPEQQDKKKVLRLEPVAMARKNYFKCLYWGAGEAYQNVFQCLKVAIISMGEWIKEKKKAASNKKTASSKRVEPDGSLERFAEGKARELLEKMGFPEPQDAAGKEALVPLENVEVYYSIGQALDKLPKLQMAGGQEIFDAMALCYREIQKTLERIDKYYIGLKQETGFAGSFKEAFQTKLLFGEIEMPDSLREKFISVFHKLVAVSAGTVAVKVKSPGH